MNRLYSFSHEYCNQHPLKLWKRDRNQGRFREKSQTDLRRHDIFFFSSCSVCSANKLRRLVNEQTFVHIRFGFGIAHSATTTIVPYVCSEMNALPTSNNITREITQISTLLSTVFLLFYSTLLASEHAYSFSLCRLSPSASITTLKWI